MSLCFLYKPGEDKAQRQKDTLVPRRTGRHGIWSQQTHTGLGMYVLGWRLNLSHPLGDLQCPGHLPLTLSQGLDWISHCTSSEKQDDDQKNYKRSACESRVPRAGPWHTTIVQFTLICSVTQSIKRTPRNVTGDWRSWNMCHYFKLFLNNNKVSACNVGDPGLILGLGRSPGKWNGNPLQNSCLENSIDRGTWQAIIHGVAKSQTWLRN